MKGKKSLKKLVKRSPSSPEANKLTDEVEQVLKELKLPASSQRQEIVAKRFDLENDAEICSVSSVDDGEEEALELPKVDSDSGHGIDFDGKQVVENEKNDKPLSIEKRPGQAKKKLERNVEQHLEHQQTGKHVTFSDDDEESDDEESDDEESGDEIEETKAYSDPDSNAFEKDPFRWFEEPLEPLDGISEITESRNQTPRSELRDRADRLLLKRSSVAGNQNDQEIQWMRKMMRMGTLSDKIAAMALLVSKDPVASIETLENLVSCTQKKNRREAQLAINALTDLFSNTLLPPDRLLKSFNDQVDELDTKSLSRITDEHLVRWALEGEIKGKYLQFIRSLEQWSYDNLEYAKRTAIVAIFKLLLDKPEQEQYLLMILVKKLGDLDKKVASKVVYLLSKLVAEHPNMRFVVVKEVERFILNPVCSNHTIYYGTLFLNQIILQRNGDEDLANKLIEIYIRLFRDVISSKDETSEKSSGHKNKPASRKSTGKSKGKKGRKGKPDRKNKQNDVNTIAQDAASSRLLGAVFTGINRAFPYSKSKGEDFKEQIDVLFEMVHKANFNSSTQVFVLLMNIMMSDQTLADRFYRALYAKLLSPELYHTSKKSMFFNLLYRSLRHDTETGRVCAFLKRLVQVCSCGPAPLAAGALILVSALMQSRRSLLRMIRGDIANAGLAKSQLGSTESSKEICEPNNRQNGNQRKSNIIALPKLHIVDDMVQTEGLGNVEMEAKKSDETEQLPKEYDLRARDPRFAGCSDSTYLWEIAAFLSHYHPTVRVFAAQILLNMKKGIDYRSNPFQDLSNSGFLDRFVYRNPRRKDIETLRNSSAKGSSVFGKHGRVGRLGATAAAQAVNSAEFLLKDKLNVKAEDRFFHEYFHTKAQNEGSDLRSDMAQKLLHSSKEDIDPFLRDDHAEFDEYAEKLANDMMRSTYGAPDIDEEFDLDFDYDDELDDHRAGRLGNQFEDAISEASENSTDENEEFFEEELDDEDEDEDEDLDSEEPDSTHGGSHKRKPDTSLSNFADLDEISEMIESSGKDALPKKQREWENRISGSKHSMNRKRRKKAK